jgi:hypothetical protein
MNGSKEMNRSFMKTYSTEKMDELIVETLSDIENDKGNTFYIDLLSTGEYAVSQDEFCLGVFDSKLEAEQHRESFLK